MKPNSPTSRNKCNYEKKHSFFQNNAHKSQQEIKPDTLERGET